MKNYPAFRVKVGLMKKASADKMNQLENPACKVVNIVFLSISFTICFGSQKNHLFEMFLYCLVSTWLSENEQQKNSCLFLHFFSLFFYWVVIWASMMRKKLFSRFANNKDADQPAPSDQSLCYSLTGKQNIFQVSIF